MIAQALTFSTFFLCYSTCAAVCGGIVSCGYNVLETDQPVCATAGGDFDCIWAACPLDGYVLPRRGFAFNSMVI